MAGLLWILISACGSDSTQNAAPGLKPPVAKDVASKPSKDRPDRLAPPTSFVPLPSLEQVLSAVPDGRPDPFAPVVVAGSPAATDPRASDADQPPSLGLQVQGVLAVGGQRRALVTTSEGSGPVCVGERGRCPGESSGLLPVGWVVQAIDLRRGCLTVSVAGQSESPFCIA
ncbi:hypothetical protein [Synechococcus sp. PROS-7-1]|uniref:hypothetical protein n=1 Tax=Synechococcus sp. PROS-7-1 TaxID=1442556 RepID=UPI0016467E10|nr:hypothetical protein [Synechococcus sp. PROS-7-1]